MAAVGWRGFDFDGRTYVWDDWVEKFVSRRRERGFVGVCIGEGWMGWDGVV